MDKPTTKPATIEGSILNPVRFRWSPRAFSDQPISERDLRLILTAAQWAPSTFNEQEWRFIVARKENPEQFARALACLVDKNQQWARLAPVLMFVVGRTTFGRNGRPNPVWHYDCGLAGGQLLMQATALGIYVHQMAGIVHDAIRQTYKVPAEFEPLAGIALGYMGRLLDLPEEFHKEEQSPRSRRPLLDTVFADQWGKPGLRE